MDWQTEFLQWITSYQNPLINQIVSFFAFAGTESFYILVIPLVYWCISKTIGFRFLYIVLGSLYVNMWIKASFPVKRPIGVEGINSIFIESAQEVSQFPNDSFPSGHAQGASTFWGYLSYQIRNTAFWIFAGLMILFTALSRLYSGLHWPTDVIGGILFGIILLIVGIILTPVIESLTRPFQWTLAIIFPIVMVVLFHEPEGIKISGILLGAGIGYLLEQDFLRMNLHAQVWRKAIAYIIGITGLLLIQRGLKLVFPETLLWDFIRYSCIGIWATLIAPYIFVISRLYSRDDHKSIFNSAKLSG